MELHKFYGSLQLVHRQISANFCLGEQYNKEKRNIGNCWGRKSGVKEKH
jgi:hypothetical protein